MSPVRIAQRSEPIGSLASYRLEVDDWIDAGGWVIHLTRWTGRAQMSGAEVEGGYGANASRFRGGKLVEWIGYSRPRIAALEAVELTK